MCRSTSLIRIGLAGWPIPSARYIAYQICKVLIAYIFLNYFRSHLWSTPSGVVEDCWRQRDCTEWISVDGLPKHSVLEQGRCHLRRHSHQSQLDPDCGPLSLRSCQCRGDLGCLWRQLLELFPTNFQPSATILQPPSKFCVWPTGERHRHPNSSIQRCSKR